MTGCLAIAIPKITKERSENGLSEKARCHANGGWPCSSDSVDRANRSASTVFEYGFPHLLGTSISSVKTSGYSHGLGQGNSPVGNEVSSVTGAWNDLALTSAKKWRHISCLGRKEDSELC